MVGTRRYSRRQSFSRITVGIQARLVMLILVGGVGGDFSQTPS